jgi:hypothetical protein
MENMENKGRAVLGQIINVWSGSPSDLEIGFQIHTEKQLGDK